MYKSVRGKLEYYRGIMLYYLGYDNENLGMGLLHKSKNSKWY